MVIRFWRMLKWLSICLFFNIWVSKHVNVFRLPGTKSPICEDVRIDTKLNKFLWSNGVRNAGEPSDDLREVGCFQWLHLRCLAVCACACPASATRPEENLGKAIVAMQDLMYSWVEMLKLMWNHGNLSQESGRCINCQTTSWVVAIPSRGSRKVPDSLEIWVSVVSKKSAKETGFNMSMTLY